MPPIHRRTALTLLGTAAVSTAATGSATASAGQAGDDDEDDDAGEDRQVVGEIFRLGHTPGSDPPGAYAEEDVRVDGEMALLSSFLGEGGTFLYDIRDPTDPTEVHRLRSAPDVRNADCAFDPREGLYYRSQEPNGEEASLEGVEVVDYGFQRGSVEGPVIVSKISNGPTHNLFPHPDPETPVLYTTHEEMTMKAWDVSDPSAPEELFAGIAGGSAHDVVVDPTDEILYFAGEVPVDEDGNVDEREGGGHHDEAGDEDRGRFFSYAFFDVSDPGEPELLGGLDPTEYTSLEGAGMDGAGFKHGGGHYADYDPRRAIAYVSDETGRGVPAGKWALDVGWKDGSFEDPVPLGFTRSPNAELQEEVDELFDWTTHNHDVVPKPDATLLVSGDYHEGTVVYDFTDPENPAPSDQYRTDDGADEVGEGDGPMFFPEEDSPPMAWGANYNEERDLTVTSDMWTGLYVFTVTPTVNEDGGGDTEGDSDGDSEGDGENDDGGDDEENASGGDEDDHDDGNGDGSGG
jgi:hypothetical protein